MHSPNIHRIAIGQIDSQCGVVEPNLEVMTNMIARARDESAEGIVFPELALTGYLVDNRYTEAARMLDSPEIKDLVDQSKDIDICFGFIEETPASLFYNSALYLSGGKITHLHRKIYLPTYGLFDERRFFGAGWEVSAFDATIARSAVLVCGDAWHLPLAYLAAHDGADVIYIIAASSTEGLADTTPCNEAWRWMCRSYALTLSCFVVFVNHSGNDGQRDFWGKSFIAGPDGNLCAEVESAEQAVLVSEIDLGELRRQRIKLPFRRDDSLAHTLHLGQRVLENKIERDGAVGPDGNSLTVAPKPR